MLKKVSLTLANNGIIVGLRTFQPTLVHAQGWSGGAMVLGKLPVPGHPTLWMNVGQGPTALIVGAGGIVWTFLFSYIFSLLFLPVFGRRPDID